MKTRGWYTVLMALLVSAGLGACASAPSDGAGAGAATVIVRNDLIPPSLLRVYSVPEGGIRRLIGTVEPGGTDTLSFTPAGGALEHRFLGETTAGRDVVSNPVSVTRGVTIQWNVSSNIATVRTSDR